MRRPEVRLPDVYIIGAQKSGTTSLFDWIAQHPQVSGSAAVKDYPFFSRDETYERGIATFSKYLSKASFLSVVLGGDANAMYVPQAAERLHRHLPNARLIAILRDPIRRCYSAWRYAVERQLEVRSFEGAILDELNGVPYCNKDEKMQKDYLGHGLYGAQLKVFLGRFKAESIKIVLFEELREEPATVMHEIFDFIGVDSTFQPVFTTKNKTQGGARFRWLSSLLYERRTGNGIAWRLARTIVPASGRAFLREWLVNFNRVYRPISPLTEEMKLKLQKYYASDREDLEAILGRRLDAWRC